MGSGKGIWTCWQVFTQKLRRLQHWEGTQGTCLEGERQAWFRKTEHL